MSDRPASPAIRDHAWGRLEVEDLDGAVHRYKDAKLFPGGSRAWDWNETGTGHEPGIQPGDVEELIGAGAEVVVLTRGVHGRLRVPEDTVRHVEEAGARAEVLRTEQAIRRYEELRREGRAVGALVHSTC